MRKTRFVVVATAVLATVLFFGVMCLRVQAAGNVTILQHYNFYVPPSVAVNPLNSSQNITVEATFMVMGEIENVGDAPVTNIKVTANYYNASNAFINSTETSILPIISGMNDDFVLMPGAKASFYEMMLEDSGAENVDHYNLTATFQPSNPLPPMLQITVDQVIDYTDPANPARADALTVNGTITNLGTSATDNWYVYVSGYDASGQQIGSDHYGNNLLGPGETQSFHVTVQNDYKLDPNVAKDFANYTITAQSDFFNETLFSDVGQYASVTDINGIVPEYRSLLPALLLFIALVSVMVAYIKKRS